MDLAIELRGVEFSYGERKALKGVSFSVEAGRVAGLLGPNGGGKTTTFRILSTLLRPEAGSATIFGKDVVSDPYGVRRLIGVVFQNRSLDLELTVRENLVHQGHLYGLRGRNLSERIAELAERFGIVDRLSERAKSLSGGLQRRVDLAKALLSRPRLLLLDEPTNGLDPKVSRDFWNLLRELNRSEGMSILLTTHSMEEAERCDQLIILANGAVVTKGSPASLKEQVGPEIVTLRSPVAEDLLVRIREDFELQPDLVEGVIRIEHDNGHELVAKLAQRFEDSIESVTVSRATLEDVFIRETGQTLGN
jgi:ABC-2 type transport system ATP-binding protein